MEKGERNSSLVRYFALTGMSFTPFGKDNGLRENLGREILEQEGIVSAESPWTCYIMLSNLYPLPWR
jgi:hypothetical protein